MVMRDQGPKESLGYGVSFADLPVRSEREAGSPDSGVVARYFEGSPIKKFFASTAAVIVGATVAGVGFRKAGTKGLQRLGRKAFEEPGSIYATAFSEYRNIQKTLDEYASINRKVTDNFDPLTDELTVNRGFFITEGEREAARRSGQLAPAQWNMRDELQQRLIRQGRRLPYELPAAYVTQRFVSDPLLGNERDKVNWSNPVDVIGDFANQSMKNLAFAFLPFEVGTGAAQQGWRKALTQGSNANYSGLQKVGRDVAVNIDKSLAKVGQQFGDLTSRAVRYSQGSIGAASAAVTDSAAKQRGLVDHLNLLRKTGPVEYAKRLASGEEVLSPALLARDVYRGMRSRLAEDVPEGAGRRAKTKFEDMIDSVTRLERRGAKFSPETFKEGDFYRKLSSAKYRDTLEEQLLEMGVDEDAVRVFTRRGVFSPPKGREDAADLTRRVWFGGEKILDDSIESGVKRRLSPVVGDEQADAVSANIRQAMKKADAKYRQSRPRFDREVEKAWQDVYGGVIAGKSKQMLGMEKMAYGKFAGDSLGTDARETLVRRTAAKMGIETPQSVSTSSLKRQIKARGLNADDPYTLRGFLIQEKDISKPWRAEGRNIFGLRAMTVGSALERGYFNDLPEESLNDINRFAKAVRKTDWDKATIDRMKVGGVYETASGGVVNLNEITRPFKRALTRTSEETKVPFIQLRPGEMVRSFFGRRSPNMVEFSTDSNPFVRGAEGTSGLLWMQMGRRGQGKLTGINVGGQADRARSQAIAGSYKSIETSNPSLRYAARDDGRFGRGGRSRAGRALDIDQYQPDSLVDYARRFRRRKQDIRNPATFARMYLEEGHVGLTRRGFSDTEIAGAADNMFQFWSKQSIPKQLQRAVEKNPKQYPHLSRLNRAGGSDSLYGMDSAQLLRKARELEAEDLSGLDRVTQRKLNNLRKQAVTPWATPQNLDAPVSNAARSAGVTRVKDKAVLDLMRYSSIKEAMEQGIPYEMKARSLMSEIGDLQSTGAISRTEAAEARAAVASTNGLYQRIKDVDPTAPRQWDTRNVMSKLLQSSPVTPMSSLEQVMRDTAEYGTHGALARRAKQMFGTAPYEFDGVTTNPFGGGADRTFVPTLGTAFSSDPMGAIKSALGFSTWNNPQNFSVAGVGTTRLVTRVNDALGTFNLRLGSENYHGPMDMLARGMVGRRVLPVVAGGATILAADRTLGGYVAERDDEGNRVYQPLLTGGLARGFVEAQSIAAGIAPGGMSAAEKREQLLFGEEEVRRGRYWLLGNSPWKGGKVDYHRPSWYRRFTSGYQYTEESFGTPMEQLLYGYDFSPLRPLDPYRYERRTSEARPYPISGEYFSGPWGPLTPALNMTVGRVLKPQRMMHEEELAAAMNQAQLVGDYGMSISGSGGMGRGGLEGTTQGIGYGAGSPQDVGAYLSGAAGTPAYMSGSKAAGAAVISDGNAPLAYLGSPNMVARTGNRMPPNIMANTPALRPGGVQEQSRELAYRAQEFSGIYGFAFGAARESLGMGSMEYEHFRPVLASASEAYGASRTFWDWNLGGLGDFPTPLEGEYANLEASEIIRRFVPKPRARTTINPLRNDMPAWLPKSPDYFLDFQHGDIRSKLPSGEMRLPGTAYERFHKVERDQFGDYGLIDRMRILGDTAPYSSEFYDVAAQVRASGQNLTEYTKIMERVAKIKQRHEFYDYEHQDSSALNPKKYLERAAHMDTWFNNKFMPHRTAVEDWERNYVYGSNFQQWSNPYSDFIKPMAYQSADRHPLLGAAAFGTLGHLMGATRESRAVGRVIGGLAGFGISSVSAVRETITGQRFVPRERKKEMAVEEMTDILTYVKGLRGAKQAQASGDMATAEYFVKQMRSTMYGMDLRTIEQGNIDQLSRAIPKRKREHFQRFITETDPDVQDRILETSSRLERRIYQAAWGRQIEARPTLSNYFKDRELPGPTWEGWDQQSSMEHVKIKMMQREGVNMSQMGYYPQQIAEANLVNPSYPEFGFQGSSPEMQIEQLLAAQGIRSSVRAVPTPFPGLSLEYRS